MDNRNLARVDDGLAVKAHVFDQHDFLPEALEIVEVGPDRVKALHTRSARRNDHLLARTHELHAGAGDLGLEILRVVAARERNADHAIGRGADFVGVHDALGGLKCRH